MLRSLRFRLPALFLAGVVLAGIVSTAIAFQLLQSYSRSQSFKELRREAVGLTELYAEKATGDRLYYIGSPIFFTSATPPLRVLPRTVVDWRSLQEGKIVKFEFDAP